MGLCSKRRSSSLKPPRTAEARSSPRRGRRGSDHAILCDHVRIHLCTCRQPAPAHAEPLLPLMLGFLQCFRDAAHDLVFLAFASRRPALKAIGDSAVADPPSPRNAFRCAPHHPGRYETVSERQGAPDFSPGGAANGRPKLPPSCCSSHVRPTSPPPPSRRFSYRQAGVSSAGRLGTRAQTCPATTWYSRCGDSFRSS